MAFTLQRLSTLVGSISLVAALTVFPVSTNMATAKTAEPDPEFPSVTLTSPNGGETFYPGGTMHITWNQKNVDTVTLFYKTCQSCLDYIASRIPVDIHATTGSYTWNIPSYLPLLNTYKIFIFVYHTGVGSVGDESDGYFRMAPAPVLAASLAPTTPLSQGIQVGQNNVVFTRVRLAAVTLPFTVSRVTIQSDPPAAASALERISVYNIAGTELGYVKKLNPTTGSGTIVFTQPLQINADSIVELIIAAQVVNYPENSSTIRLGITELYRGSLSLQTVGLPVFGYPMFFER